MIPSTWAVVVGMVAVIFGSGYGLSRLGKPYNGLLFNAHKLLALGAVIFLAVTLVRANRAAPLDGAWIAAVVTGVCVLDLFATGALHSITATGGLATMSEDARTAIRLVHKVTPYLAAVSAVVTLALLKN